MSEGKDSNSDASDPDVDWSDALRIFNMDDEFVYDLIPPEVIKSTNDNIPDWYINFTNSEPTTIDTSSPVDANTHETEPTSKEPEQHSPTSIITPDESDATSNQYLSYNSVTCNAILPKYYQPNTNIKKFNKEFPLPPRLSF